MTGWQGMHAAAARRFWPKLATLALLLASWAYLTPMFTGVRVRLWGELGTPVVVDPLARSLIVASVSSLASVLTGFALSIAMRNISVGTHGGTLMAILTLPVVVGDLVIGFAFKAITMDREVFQLVFADRPQWAVLTAIIVMQVWQYGLLCGYLFWLRVVSIEQPVADFAKISGLTLIEWVRDVLWPRCRELAMVLLLITFFAAAHEYAKSWLVFKVSPGTRTSLTSHALWELYQQRLPVNPAFAQATALQACLMVGGAILLCAIIIMGVLYTSEHALVRGMNAKARCRERHCWEGAPVEGSAWYATCWLVAAAAMTLVPLLSPPARFAFSLSIEWTSVIKAASGSAVAGAFALLVAFVFGVVARVSSPSGFARFTPLAVCVSMALLALRSIPPLAFILSGYHLFAYLHGSRIGSMVSWLIGHALLALPLLGVFTIWLHTRVSQNELEFQEGAGVSIAGIANRSFVSRFPLDYAFLFLFAWSLVWNESTLNRVVSDTVPTFVDLLSRQLSVRADFSRSTTLCLVSVLLGLAAISLWRMAQTRGHRFGNVG